MGSENGHLLGAPNIPIVGQSCKFVGFVPNVLMQCQCEGKHPLLAVGLHAVAKCPGCGHRFKATVIAFDANTNKCVIQIDQVLTPEDGVQR